MNGIDQRHTSAGRAGGDGRIRTDVGWRRRFCRPSPSTAWLRRRERHGWRGCTGSNREPSVLETDALPVELHPHVPHPTERGRVPVPNTAGSVAPRARFERATLGFVNRCSCPLSYNNEVNEWRMRSDSNARAGLRRPPLSRRFPWSSQARIHHLVPQEGIEPPTLGLSTRRSTG